MTPQTDNLEARAPITHELKCWPEPFAAVKSGAKNFEWRKDDRDYRVGDTLVLKEFAWGEDWDEPGAIQEFTGDQVTRTVTYIIRDGFGIPEGYCIMGLRSLAPPQGAVKPVQWHRPADKKPPQYIIEGHILIGYSNRKQLDEDYSLRQIAYCGLPPEETWTDSYGSIPIPDWWTIIPIPEKDEARWYMPKRVSVDEQVQGMYQEIRSWLVSCGSAVPTRDEYMSDLRERLKALLSK